MRAAPPERPKRSVTLAVALAVGCCAAAVTYSLSRAIQFYFFPAPDPRTVVVVSRIAFFWRAQVAAYAGALAALGAGALRSRSGAQFDRALPHIVTATIVVTTVQGVFVP